MNLNSGSQEYGLASLGSKNIKIAIDKEVGITKFAGLIFDKEVTLNIHADSTVELREENISVKDYLNNNWISRKLKYTNGTRILLVANDLQNMADKKQRQKIEDSTRIADSIYDATTNYNPQEIFQFAEEMPEFPGGTESLMKFIDENIDYPKSVKENNIEGRVFVRFVVLYNGKIGEISVLRGIDPLLDAEAISVIKKLPRWQPGKQNGKRVNVSMILPVEFKLH
jgi:TonB family protein